MAYQNNVDNFSERKITKNRTNKRNEACPKMSRLNAGPVSSQMPYSVPMGFQFLFREPGYRFVKFTEYRGFIIRQ